MDGSAWSAVSSLSLAGAIILLTVGLTRLQRRARLREEGTDGR